MTRHLAATALLFGSLALPAGADFVDQSQLSAPNYMARFSQGDLAQSFRQQAGNITGASVKLEVLTGVGTGDVTIALYDALPNQGGTLLASGTDRGVVAGAFATVSWDSVAIQPETTYYLVFTSSNSMFGLSGDLRNPYSRGQTFAGTGYEAYPDFDYTFQTFAAAPIVPVPEPAGLILTGLGVLGIALYRTGRGHPLRPVELVA